MSFSQPVALTLKQIASRYHEILVRVSYDSPSRILTTVLVSPKENKEILRMDTDVEVTNVGQTSSMLLAYLGEVGFMDLRVYVMDKGEV